MSSASILVITLNLLIISSGTGSLLLKYILSTMIHDTKIGRVFQNATDCEIVFSKTCSSRIDCNYQLCNFSDSYQWTIVGSKIFRNNVHQDCGLFDSSIIIYLLGISLAVISIIISLLYGFICPDESYNKNNKKNKPYFINICSTSLSFWSIIVILIMLTFDLNNKIIIPEAYSLLASLICAMLLLISFICAQSRD